MVSKLQAMLGMKDEFGGQWKYYNSHTKVGRVYASCINLTIWAGIFTYFLKIRPAMKRRRALKEEKKVLAVGQSHKA